MASTGNEGATRPHIFIQTNNKQSIGAIVSAYSMKRSPHADKFDVTIMHKEDYPWFAKREGQSYKRHGVDRVWHENDLQSFTLTRFLPPQLMGYQGRALVVDPDVFAVQDVWELLTRDMKGKAIMCRGSKFKNGAYASSVMLLDCAKLKHWDVEKGFNELFEGKRDYHQWISLLMEDPNTNTAYGLVNVNCLDDQEAFQQAPIVVEPLIETVGMRREKRSKNWTPCSFMR